MSFNNTQSSVNYTTVDLNTTGATTLFDPSGDARVTGVFMANGGSTAEVALEVTDGSDTAALAVPGAGNAVEFGDTVEIGEADSVQVDVTVAEGTAETTTAAVFTTE